MNRIPGTAGVVHRIDMVGVRGSGVAEVEARPVRPWLYRCTARPGLHPVVVGYAVALADGRLIGVWTRTGRRLLRGRAPSACLDALEVFLPQPDTELAWLVPASVEALRASRSA